MAKTTSKHVEIEIDPKDVRRGDLVKVGLNRWESAEMAWEWEADPGYRHIGLKLIDFFWPIHISAYRTTKLTVRRQEEN